ncbi:Group 2 truncated hemoglobin GlbO [BD1-7 clade bacterium]|uniref:Group 2 truncated hemoglobin GlbO n=1 Tax=BD1-7 clade bacterium TaxID=2029982 RepID=A0A5S9QYU1_9GAMM|nr:Group 2 truncated hemoglobin GlbO [BD1-7 clade bacterium]
MQIEEPQKNTEQPDNQTDLDAGGSSLVFGEGDGSFKAAGGEAGLQSLVADFYRIMGERPDARRVHDMHSDAEAVSVDKLARFLSGWLGGPKRYREKYGKIHIPQAHRHLDIGVEERDAWLNCMKEAIDLQPYAPEFKTYLITQLRVPAERSRTR